MAGYSMGSGRRRQQSTGDALEDLSVALEGLAQVKDPKKSREPILHPTVRAEVQRWMVEMRKETELNEAGVPVRKKLLAKGPSGTGKTSLAHHIAARFGWPLVIIGPETIGSPYIHQGSMNIGKVFDVLEESEHSALLFIDEIESMVPDRSLQGAGNQSLQQETTVMLRRFEQYDGLSIGATNQPDIIDKAMWRRFQIHLEIGLPGDAERWAILKQYSQPYDLSVASYDILTEVTAGASPAMLEELMIGLKRGLILNPIMKLSIDNPAKVILPAVLAHSPPPEITPPPLWRNKSGCWEMVAQIVGADGTWPPKRISNKD